MMDFICKYKHYHVITSPFGGRLMVSKNFILPQSSEEMFYFETKDIPYLCRLWHFANSYIIFYVRKEINNMKKRKQILAFTLALALVFSCFDVAINSITVESANKIKFSTKSSSIVIGGTKKIKIKNTKKGAKITYKSNKKSIATVSKKGKVKGIKAGNAKITVSVKQGRKTTKLSYKVKVKKPVLSRNSVKLTKGKTYYLSIKNKPKKATYKWSSDNASVASVNSFGKVTANRKGNTIIRTRVKTQKSTYYLSCYVNVNDNGDDDTEKYYTITFNSNGGSFVSSQFVKEGGYISKPTNPTKEGYVFAGWYTNSSLTNEYAFNSSVWSNLTLYAKWEETQDKTYIVTFNSNGGTDVVSLTIKQGESAIKPSDPTKNGYTFAGWYSDFALTYAYNFSTSITSNITLYAKWDAIQVTPEETDKIDVDITASYGGTVNTVGGKYNKNEPIDLSATADNGWIFAEWNSSDGGTFSDSKDTNTKFSTDKDTTVIAVFEKVGQSEMSKDEAAVQNAYYGLSVRYSVGDYEDAVTQDLFLNSEYGKDEEKVNVTWLSSDTNIVNENGKVTRPVSEDKEVILTAIISKSSYHQEKHFKVMVKKQVDIGSNDIDENNVIDIIAMNNDENRSVEIEYNEEEDQVESIDGKYSDIIVDSPETALNSIYSVKSILGIDSPKDELENQAQNLDENTVSYTFSQEYNDIPVYGTSVTVVSDLENGEVHSLHSSVISTEKLKILNLVPGLSKEEIKNRFEGAKSCRLYIYGIKDHENDPILTYLITTNDETIIADANSGEVVLRFHNIKEWGDYSTTGRGSDENGNILTFPVQFHQWDFYFYYQEDVERQIFLKGDKSSAITHEFNTDWSDMTANSAYANTIEVYDWYKQHLNRNSIDNHNMPIIVNVHAPRTWSWRDWEWKGNNAYWDGSSISFLDNNSSSNKVPTTANGLDITAHELTHGVLEKVIMQEHPNEDMDDVFPYADETGAINEGYADVFGYLVDNENWTIGENWKTGGIRSLAHPENFGDPIALDDQNVFIVTADPNTDSDEYNDQQSILVHQNSSLVYHAAFLMHTYGLQGEKLEKLWYSSMSKGYDATSDYHTVRRNLIKAAKDNKFSDEDISKVRKAFDTEKIYAEKGSLKVNLQDINGNSLKINSENEIKYSFVRTKNDVPKSEINKSQYGGVSIDEKEIYFGDYEATINAPGYVSFTGNVTIEEGKTTEITVTLVEDGNGKAGGIITSATTGKPISGVLLRVRLGWNTKTGDEVITGISNDEGYYEFELPAGYYTLEASKTDYSIGYLNLSVEGGFKKLDQNTSISPNMELGDNFRVVLTWGENPHDLDSHLIGICEGQYNYHVYYSNQDGYDNDDNLVANLDVDDTSSYGPETTTFTVNPNGLYEYYIDWYSGSGTWATSSAKVELYNGMNSEPIYVFDVPNWEYGYGQWKVFTYKNGILKKEY